MQVDYPAKEFKAQAKRKKDNAQASEPSPESQPSRATAAKSACRKEPADEPKDMPDEEPTSKPDREPKTKPDNQTTTKPQNEATTIRKNEATTIPENEATTIPENEATTKPSQPPVKQHLFQQDTNPNDSESDLEDVLIDQEESDAARNKRSSNLRCRIEQVKAMS